MSSYSQHQILEDDDDFDPKTEDIHQYCEIIGLDPKKDEDLLWVAKEGILAKLQPPWKAINQDGVGLYYFNFETGQSMWEHPNDEYYRHKVKQERERKKSGRKPKSSKELAPIRGAHIKPVPDFGPTAINFSNFTPSPPPGAPHKPLSPRFNVEILKASAGRFLSDSKSESSSSLTPEAAIFLKKQKLLRTESRSPEQNPKQESSSTVCDSLKIQDSPRLAPLKTPRSGSASSISDFDLIRSSNDSLGKFNLGKVVLGSTSENDETSQNSPRGDGAISALDIGDLQPAQPTQKAESPEIDVSTSSNSVSSSQTSKSKSSSSNYNRFIKKSAENHSVSESSLSKSSSKRSKSESKSFSKSSSKSAKPAKISDKSSHTKKSVPVSVQIEHKKNIERQKIEEELMRIQIELQETRQNRYDELMDEHEKEMYRMEREVARMTQAQSQEQQDRLEEVRKNFESQISQAIEEEKTKNQENIENALIGLRAQLENSKKDILDAEERRMKDETERTRSEIESKTKERLTNLKRDIASEEEKKLDLLQTELVQKKHENRKLEDQNREIFESLRENRHDIEEKNKAELDEIMKNHIEKKKTLLDLQQKEIRELEKGHIDKISSLHEKFEHDLEKKKAALEAKRKVFDQRVEKWEADHSDRKMTWASANHTRKTEFENHSVYRLADTLKNLSQSQEDSPMTRNDLDSSNITSPQTFAMAQSSIPSREIPENVQKSSSPASERLREYLQGLEKKLDAFSSLIVSESASDPLTSTRKSLPSEIPDSRQSIPSYRSERWRDYFGADFKYIPAKTELNQRLSQDYRTLFNQQYNLRYRQLQKNRRRIENCRAST